MGSGSERGDDDRQVGRVPCEDIRFDAACSHRRTDRQRRSQHSAVGQPDSNDLQAGDDPHEYREAEPGSEAGRVEKPACTSKEQAAEDLLCNSGGRRPSHDRGQVQRSEAVRRSMETLPAGLPARGLTVSGSPHPPDPRRPPTGKHRTRRHSHRRRYQAIHFHQ